MNARHKIIISTIKNSSILHRLPPVTRIHEVAREMSQSTTIFIVFNLRHAAMGGVIIPCAL